MKLLKSYGDDNPIEIGKSLHYSIAHGYTVPPKYLKKNIVEEDVLNMDLLKKELDLIIRKAPIKILPFGWPEIENFATKKAEVDQFVGEGSKTIPRSVLLYVNHSLEMIEPDLEYEGKILFFRALSDNVVTAFEFGEKDGYFKERDFFDIRIKRFYP